MCGIHWEGTEESKTPAAGGLHPDQVPGACTAWRREPASARRRLPARAACQNRTEILERTSGGLARFSKQKCRAPS